MVTPTKISKLLDRPECRPIPNAEQLRLVKLAAAGDVLARERVVLSYARLAYQTALRLCDFRHIEDGFQCAIGGVSKAVDRFDPSRAPAFSTYAHYWIMHGITHGMRKIKRDAYAIDLARLDAQLPARSNEPRMLLDVVGTDDTDQLDLSIDIDRALGCLSYRSRCMVELSLFNGLNLQEVGERFGVSRERARQILIAAMSKLSRRMQAYGETQKKRIGRVLWK